MNRTWHVDPWHSQSVWAIDLVKLMLTHIDLQDIVPVHFCSCGQCLKVFLKSFVWSLPSIWVFLHSGSWLWSISLTLSVVRWPLTMSGTKPYENSPWKDTTNSPSTRARTDLEEPHPTPPAIVSNLNQQLLVSATCTCTNVSSRRLFSPSHQISVPFPWSDPWTLSLYDSSTAVFLNVAETAVGCSTCVSISHVY